MRTRHFRQERPHATGSRRAAALVLGLLHAQASAAGAGAAVASVPCLSGFVRDTAGRPVASGDLDFYDVASGVKIFTPRDNTDLSGFYNVCVLPGVYDVTYAPPPGTHLLGKELFAVDLTVEPGHELDVVLEAGTVVSGRILTAGGQPLDVVDVDVDRLSGGRVFTPNDKSVPGTGAYAVVVPNGTYRIRFDPPPGARWQGVQLDSVSVRRDTTIDITLPPGVLLQGRVQTTTGTGIPGVDVDLRQRDTGAKVFVSNKTTDANGDYVTAVPTGTFQLRFAPPPGSLFVGALLDSVTIAGDVRLDPVLAAGVLLTCVARDSLANPVPGADIDLVVVSTHAQVYTPNDKTDAGGTAILAVVPDVYHVEFNPPPGSLFDFVVVRDVAIRGDTTIAVTLPELRRVHVTGRVTDGAGQPVADATLAPHRVPSGESIFVPNDRTDAAGAFDLAIPLGTYDVLLAPARGSRLLGRRLVNVVVDRDSTLDTIVLEPGVLFTARVVDELDRPLGGVDLDFRVEPSGEVLYTPHDNTDAAGTALVALPPGRYTVEVLPPAGSGVLEASVPGVQVRADTLVTLTLRLAPSPSGPPFVSLGPIEPNPFRRSTTILYRLSAPGEIAMSVYDVSGRLVRLLDRSTRPADAFQQVWDGTDGHGVPLRSGVYFVRLETTGGAQTRKVLLIR